jgi:hypothetical protein
VVRPKDWWPTSQYLPKITIAAKPKPITEIDEKNFLHRKKVRQKSKLNQKAMDTRVATVDE